MTETKAVDCYSVVFVRGGMLAVASSLSKGGASEVMDRQQSHDILTKKKIMTGERIFLTVGECQKQ